MSKEQKEVGPEILREAWSSALFSVGILILMAATVIVLVIIFYPGGDVDVVSGPTPPPVVPISSNQ